MRLLNVFAALSGALALVMQTIAAHVLPLEPPDAERLRLGAFVQLIAAAAGLALAGRAGRLNLIAGAMIVGGAALFAAALYTLAIAHLPWASKFAPFGGLTLIGGWLVAAFAKPRA
ncbi:MAG: DUF423 domain-containing protein [Terricaulis sp.]|nr:DUF423 domain-containing protein [Terricaulis sp.]